MSTPTDPSTLFHWQLMLRIILYLFLVLIFVLYVDIQKSVLHTYTHIRKREDIYMTEESYVCVPVLGRERIFI